MILVARGTEPPELTRTRLEQVPKLARIARTRPPTSKEISGYKEVTASPLWRAHRFKCCYCEARVPIGYNDVEHYRPKASADRSPGSTDAHGYWWLAFTWKNLLFACPTCNRSEKRALFPLASGSVALVAHQNPPGREVPLLIDPAEESAVPHIEFVFSRVQSTTVPPEDVSIGWEQRKHWWPRARGGSLRGDATIRVCGLDSGEQIELYDVHVNNEVRGIERDFHTARHASDEARIKETHGRGMRLLQPTMPYVGLSYDALGTLIPNAELAPWGLQWPVPEHVGRVAGRTRR
jgi:5-methylcytosine-specific restriction endonuclease McrA